MTFTPPSQTAHNVRVRKLHRTQSVALASRRLSRGHLARAVSSCEPAISFNKSLFLKILPISPTDSRFCKPNRYSVARKSFINNILQGFDPKIIFVIPSGAERRAQRAVRRNRGTLCSSCSTPTPFAPHLAAALAERLFIISVPLRKQRTPWHSTIKSINCGKRS